MLLSFISLLSLSWLIPPTSAFDAGNIPKNSWLTGHGYRHGDIENVLNLWVGNHTVPNGGWKFDDGDVDRIYFGNWERDYSQLRDTGGLSILPSNVLLTVVKLIGYLNYDYGGSPGFIITDDNLGVYLPVQHIDNPEGYNDGKDARKYDPRLRGPVSPLELLIDPKTGMKNYIANDVNSWDTSRQYIIRTLQSAVDTGRKALKSGNKTQKWEAYRLLGCALHTLEDFMAHSNFLELTLIQFGYTSVFPFVGSATTIDSPSGQKVFPLVTGTFERADMIHSFLGEVADYLSQESITALKQKVTHATLKQSQKSKQAMLDTGKLATIQSILTNITVEAKIKAVQSSQKASRGDERMRRRALHTAIGRIDAMHESVTRDFSDIISWLKDEKDDLQADAGKAVDKLIAFKDNVKATVLDGLSDAVNDLKVVEDKVEDLKDNLEAFVLKNLEPLLTPLISLVTQEIYKLMNTVLVNDLAQWEVFNDTLSTAPTHSLLSKDHFRLILNEPAGQIAQLITENAVSQVVYLWENPSAPTTPVLERITESLFHPAFPATNPSSDIQQTMLSFVHAWIEGMPRSQRKETIRRLGKDPVSNGENVRFEIAGGVKGSEKELKKQWQHFGQGLKKGMSSVDGDGLLGLDVNTTAGGDGTKTRRDMGHTHGHHGHEHLHLRGRWWEDVVEDEMD